MNTKLISAFTLLIIVSLIVLNSCVKTPDDNPGTTTTTSSTSTTSSSECDTCLPPVTMEGKNAFGCKINGKTWLPKGAGFTYKVIATYGNSKMLSIAAQHNEKREFFSINLQEISDTGYFAFPSSQFKYCKSEHSKVQDGVGDIFSYKRDPIDNGFFHLTRLDLNSGFVSGTFAFDLRNEDNTEIIHVTDGRFDIRF